MREHWAMVVHRTRISVQPWAGKDVESEGWRRAGGERGRKGEDRGGGRAARWWNPEKNLHRTILHPGGMLQQWFEALDYADNKPEGQHGTAGLQHAALVQPQWKQPQDADLLQGGWWCVCVQLWLCVKAGLYWCVRDVWGSSAGRSCVVRWCASPVLGMKWGRI